MGTERKNDGTTTPMCGDKTIHNGEDIFPLENMGEQEAEGRSGLPGRHIHEVRNAHLMLPLMDRIGLHMP
jgi:hypothetical protein